MSKSKRPGIGRGCGSRRQAIPVGRYLHALSDGQWHGVDDLVKKLHRHRHSITKFFRTNNEIQQKTEFEYRAENGTRKIYWRIKQ